MIKTELKLKTNITLEDKSNIVNAITNYIIGRNEDGSAYYFPYMEEPATSIAIALYLVEGLEFEENDNLFELVSEDKDIYKLVNRFINDNPEILSYIKENVDAIVEFRKQYIIHNNEIFAQEILKLLDKQKKLEDIRINIANNENKLLKQQVKANAYQEDIIERLTPEEVAQIEKRIASGEFDQEDLVNAMMKHISKTNAGSKDNLVKIDKTTK